MEALLRDEFTAYYGLQPATVTDIAINTDAVFFEIEDDIHRETHLHFIPGSGVAVYQNTNNRDVTIINYDKFVTSLPHAFQHGRKRCDLIIYSLDKQYFLLNELKDRKPVSNVRTKAMAQLVDSLTTLMAVPAINQFISGHITRKCCFFNKKAVAPAGITAPTAFGRINTIGSNGLKMSNPAIESFSFELFEFAGNQKFVM
jgi:hypothetical protein